MTDETGEDGYFHEDAATFGDRIVAARQELGLSSKELAERMGIGRETLERWENDQSEPRANKLQMLAGVLNVSMIWLMTGEGDGPTAEVQADTSMATILLELRAMREEASALSRRAARLEKALRLRPMGEV